MTETSLLKEIHCDHWGTDYPDDPIVTRTFFEIEAEYLARSGIGAKLNALTAALKKAVTDYGKPGGPWNVPDEPGMWLAIARDALKGE